MSDLAIRDRYGCELSVGDTVSCDGELGSVVAFEGLGAMVKMAADGEHIDWPSEQLEHVAS